MAVARNDRDRIDVPEAGSGHPWHAPAVTMVAIVVWLLLAALRPGATFHLAPAVVAAAWPVTERLAAPPR